jgi:1,4-alpha-glucan branching enzyme
MSSGYVHLVLHAHLPFVYSAAEPHLLEERWFFEALTECYLPLLESLEALQNDRVPFALTLSLSPTLLAMLDHPVLAQRYTDHLQRLIRLARSEEKRNARDPLFLPLARYYRDRLERLYSLYTDVFQGDIVARFGALAQAGHLELITTCATHGYLPLMRTDEAVQSQVRVGLEAFAARFGFYPRGMWLPECGYFPGLDAILAQNGVEYIFVDAHGLRNVWPPPAQDVYAPVKTPAGVAVFGRDPETSSQVWSLHSGYPGDADYREYYRDIGFELDEAYLRAFLPYPVRVSSGLKYWRITGSEGSKESYNPRRAEEKARIHAENFHCNRQRQIKHLAQSAVRAPVVTAPYDAELFGHWWFEGPQFLNNIFRKGCDGDSVFSYSTPSRYLDRHGAGETAEFFHSSWGEGGYSRVWLNQSNDWLYSRAHQAETALKQQLALNSSPGPLQNRVLSQMRRELLLAQSSDWAFMLNAGTTGQYAACRATAHLDHFMRLEEMLRCGDIRVEELAGMEADTSGLFPSFPYPARLSEKTPHLPSREEQPALMLSWEYPPQIMGGLARHVEDLSQALSALGQPVSVLTSQTGEAPAREKDREVMVYRVAPYQKAGEEIDFHDWVVQLNLVFFNHARQVIPVHVPVVLHAHDWLVGAAALGMKRFWRLPLVATIHATEHGRNGGIYTPLQKKIHAHEQRLVSGADRIICCSAYMAEEVCRLFGVPREKIAVIQNGVVPENILAQPYTGDSRLPFAGEGEAIIYFVGRLVKEKGVDVLLKALPAVFSAHPRTRAVISGKGPMLEALQEQARQSGIADRVLFTGFVHDAERNRLLATADVAVFPSLYEPFGIVALEAMVAGTPVVVSDVGGMGEVVRHGSDGLKCPPGNHEALAAAISALLEDRAMRQRLTQQAYRKAVGEYSWESLAEKTRDVYRDIREGAGMIKNIKGG